MSSYQEKDTPFLLCFQRKSGFWLITAEFMASILL